MSTTNRSSGFKKGIKAFIKHVESLESSYDGFIEEYTRIQEAQMRDQRDSYSSMDVGKLEHNLKKNRYKDIVPYDEFRIVLSNCEGDECSDYINASRIMGVSGAGDYIASQGPLPGTVNDFWRMIWEYDVEIVFMACRLVEVKKVKCSQYWADVGSSAEFGSISVLTVSEQEIFTECIQRVFQVTDGDKVHHVTQLHYCGWPDHGIPENPNDIRDIIGKMRRTRQNCKAPIVVHCSAGCGRTGTIIAIDYVWTLLENGKFDEDFSLFDLICNLRKQRVSLVQTPDQYALVNKVLKSFCEEMLAKIVSHTYENVQLNEEQTSEESDQQKQQGLSYHGSKRVPGNIVVSTVNTTAPSPSTQIDSSHPSTLTNTERNSQTQLRLLSSTERSTVGGVKTSTQPSLPASKTSVNERSLPRSISTAEGPAERNSQTLYRLLSSTQRPTVSGSKISAQTSLPASTKSFAERSLKTLPRSLSSAESTTDRNFRTLPQPSPSNYSTADGNRRHLQTVTSRISQAQIQKPQEKMDKSISNRRWSSVKSHRTPTQTTDSPHFENVVLSTQSGRFSVLAKSASVKVSTGNRVYNFHKQPDSRRVLVRSVQGARGVHSTTSDSEMQAPRQTISNPRGKLQDIHGAGPPASPTYKGFVLLTPGDARSGASRGEHHK